MSTDEWMMHIEGHDFALHRPFPLWADDVPPKSLIGERGICRFAYSQLRNDPSDAAEQEAQLTFGEVYTLKAISENQKWVQVERACDGTIAWMEEHRHRLARISESEFATLSSTDHAFVGSRDFEIQDQRGRTIVLGLGALLPFYDESSGTCRVADTSYRVQRGEVLAGVQAPKTETLLALLKQYISVVYEWGGDTSFGADCSGLVRTVCRVFGKRMPRNSGPQSQQGEVVALEDVRTGDLLFFGTRGAERIHHVGFAIRDKKSGALFLFHAGPGELQCVPIDSSGYYPHTDLSREFRVAKRVIDFE